MSVTVNMLQEHCGGRLSVPATMHRSLRFSGLIPFGDEPARGIASHFPVRASRGSRSIAAAPRWPSPF